MSGSAVYSGLAIVSPDFSPDGEHASKNGTMERAKFMPKVGSAEVQRNAVPIAKSPGGAGNRVA
jgi:hypothetical protein